MGNNVITHSFEETQSFGEEFAKKLCGGEVLCLYGDLGSGKTTFVQGLAKGLGITRRIISPTFIIMRSYEVRGIGDRVQGRGIRNFYHVDLYRVGSEQEVVDLGLLELMGDPQTVVVIEWPEKMENFLSEKRIDMMFTYVDEDTREITINS